MHQPIVRRLRAYRARIRTSLVIEGLASAALVTVGLVFLSFAIDRTQRLGFSARVFSLAVGMAVLAFVAYRQLLARLLRPMGDERLALTVEDKFPELRDRVISSLQFACSLEGKTTGRSDQSLGMMAAVTSDAVAVLAPLPLGRTIDYQRLVKAVAAAAAAWLILIVFAVVEPQLLGIWFRRNVLLTSVPWPQRTQLEVELNHKPVKGHRAVIPKGDALTVTARASGDIPETVWIRYRFAGGRRGEEALSRVGLLHENKFEVKFKNVVEPLRFTVAGGDAVTEPYSVSLVERPRIVQLKFWAVYPHYTRQEPGQLTADESFLEALPGTTLRVAAVPSKELRSARLAPDRTAGVEMVLCGDTRAGAGGPLKPPWTVRRFWATLDRDGKPVNGPWAGPNVWAGSIKVVQDCSVTVRLVDTDGLDNRPPTRFTVRIVADKAPTVVLRMKGIGDMIVPNATIPLEFRVTDDFGVKSLSLTHRFVIEEKRSDEEAVPLKHLVYQGKKIVFGAKEVRHEMSWYLARLGLQPGSVLQFRAEATDYKDVDPKNVGRTETTSLRVVTPAELMAELIRRQIDQTQDFIRVCNRHREEAKVELDALARAAATAGSLKPEEKTQLLALEQVLRQSAEEIKQVADMLDQVLQELINNKLGDEDDQSKLRSQVVQPTRTIAESLIPQLADAIKATAAGPDAEIKKRVPELARQNDRLLEEMDRVATNMLKMQTFQRIVRNARQLREVQKKLVDDIQERLKRFIEESILGPRR